MKKNICCYAARARCSMRWRAHTFTPPFPPHRVPPHRAIPHRAIPRRRAGATTRGVVSRQARRDMQPHAPRYTDWTTLAAPVGVAAPLVTYALIPIPLRHLPPTALRTVLLTPHDYPTWPPTGWYPAPHSFTAHLRDARALPITTPTAFCADYACR